MLNVNFISKWSNYGLIATCAKLNLDTGEVFDIEYYENIPNNLGYLEREYINTIDDESLMITVITNTNNEYFITKEDLFNLKNK